MTKKHSIKRSLVASILVLCLCFASFIGTTFAWFTDSVTSAGNIIKTGNLDIDVQYTLGDKDAAGEFVWKDLDGAEDIFQKGLWEPGHTEVIALKITNVGSLALKYAANMNIIDETVGKNKNGADIVLSDVLTVSTLTQQAVEADGTANIVGNITLALAFNGENKVAYNTTDFNAENILINDEELQPGVAHYLIVKVDMPETVGNEANAVDEDNVPSIEFGINVLATQFAYENDSFGKDYDADAKHPAIADKWDGTADTSWYNETDTEFTLNSAEQFAGLADLVDAGNTFEGKTIKLVTDLDLYAVDANGQRVSFDPIGYGYNVMFKGTFDGNSKTISNLYQNGWELGLDYSTEGGGLFASVVDATIKDVTIDKAEIVMECIDMGAVVGYSYGNCTYENITVKDSIVANYNRYTGGVVGEVNGTQTFKNVDVIDTTISALWGTYDASVGGIIGGKWGEANITFEDCDVSAQLDVFNDSCSNYQYYNYRLSGMLIGMSEEVTNGVATASYLTCINCTVTYGDWVNYTYCESESYGKGSYASEDEWKFKRVQAGYATDGVDPNHTHDTDESHEELMVFDQLFGGDKGVKGGKTHAGVTVIYNNK